ncbi:ATPase inhibitor subunit zeta [Ciceribacter sp. L1K22]|uniref:ATPase inhibitor subunit zeta n=1 Tax=Ciceribacter sp. L1K22 TaxID=2820275 RepID=UPI001ABE4FD9|nr:ATPase inhibitor subunit zeta [Ciceribacter sp. L1K22]MBO3758978.1 DUF1476 family protein [Ciceribacter sp. L1K22]
MTALNERARALETQFARQQELRFKADARGAAMIGRWAGYVMGIDDVEAYARSLATTQIVEPHRLLDRIRQDFANARVPVQEAEIASRMHQYLEQAADELYYHV